MRKLYVLLAGLFLSLACSKISAQTGTPDVANFTFVVNAPNNDVTFTNTSTLSSSFDFRRAYWSFGDGAVVSTPPLQGTQHHYQLGGTYTVCLKIFRYNANQNDSVLTAQVCKTVVIEANCQANFESPAGTSTNPLGRYFVAQPLHNQNKKPVSICWAFGDGRDTCIQYPSNYTGVYGVYHLYTQAGNYNVCVTIHYDGGCVATSCHTVQIIGEPDACAANFERIEVVGSTNPLNAYFKALPSHNHNKKPVRICWTFGDGRDTCIQYPVNYTGVYGVNHLYAHPDNYNVCVTILYDGGCQAQNCHTVQIIGEPDACAADFERLDPSPTVSPLTAIFKALPIHNHNKKPVRICWTFGDGRDTCIQYSNTFTGTYGVYHTYGEPGLYEVCVDILYDGGCQARKCAAIRIGRPDSCSANFEKLALTPGTSPLTTIFKALPWHNNNKKPARICWTFGDGHDTCINYLNIYTGLYTIAHTYSHAGSYQVCVNIQYFGGCASSKCETVRVGNPDTCHADFERIPLASTNDPLRAYFRALPSHNNDRKPSSVCWTFGDGRDTCIQYPENYTGQYVVAHNYTQPGQYEVCVTIHYYGGCEARKCNPVQIIRPDSCAADFERIPVVAPNNTLLSYFKALPSHNNNRKPSRVCWTFGDGRDTCINYTETFIGQYVTSHLYTHPGQYEVCVTINYFGGCQARKCRVIEVTRPDTCGADFERIPVTSTNNPLQSYFKALPSHNNNRKPSRVCWTFGDGRDTCINYTETFTGVYAVGHTYTNPGQYEVCVTIYYFGGCQARKCRQVAITRPDTCGADFERIPSTSANNPLQAYFKALPIHNNNRKPSRVCWTFGDGRDTCINYTETFTGLYAVSHTYANPGQYEVCVTINYFGGCEARKCKQVVITRPDSCGADFERIPVTSNNNFSLAYFKALPFHNNNKKPSRVCWTFGDGRDTCINYAETFTGVYAVSHTYANPGQYEVCVKILYVGGCEARKCRQIVITRPDTCGADFEKIPSTSANNPLQTYFKALPIHNNNRKPSRVCWTFGDGHDTCINYTETFTGQYVTSHLYANPGQYEVCVNILYFGGCEARKCRVIQITRPDSCRADFATVTTTAGTTPLTVGFTALPWHNNNKKPIRICWQFGDGRDTCITYPTTFTGQYFVAHHYTQPGQYQVCVSILYDGGCESRKCAAITVPPQVTTCAVNIFEITPSITSLVRGFLAVPHTEPTTRRPERICWTFGDGRDTCIMIDPLQPVPELTIHHAYPGPGVYNACVRIVFQGGCTAENCREVVIRAASNVCGGYMTDSLTGPRTYKFKGFSINNPNDEVLTYRWTFGDGTTTLGREVTHTYAQGGNYQVCLTIVTRLGCETRVCKTINVPGNNEPALHLTPNPVINTMHVEFLSTLTEQVNIRILNGFGNVVRTYTRTVTAGANSWDVDLSTLMPGIYTFIVQSPNQLASAIFIKQ